MVSLYRYSFSLNASHSMDYKHKHSHTFKITLYIKTDESLKVTFNEYERIVKDYLDAYKGKYINEIAPFDSKVPTLENMSKVFYQKINDILLDCNLDLVKLEIGDGYTISVSLGEWLITGSNVRIIPLEKFELYKNKILKKYNINTEEKKRISKDTFILPIFERKIIEEEFNFSFYETFEDFMLKAIDGK